MAGEFCKGEEKEKKADCQLSVMEENSVFKKKAQPPKIERLRKNYQFQKIYRQGRSQATYSTVLYFKKNGMACNRAGIVVSKKVGKSVVRHRLKRIYREALRSLQQYLKSGNDLVIIARKGADQLTYWEIQADLRKLFMKGKLMQRC